MYCIYLYIYLVIITFDFFSSVKDLILKINDISRLFQVLVFK